MARRHVSIIVVVVVVVVAAGCHDAGAVSSTDGSSGQGTGGTMASTGDATTAGSSSGIDPSEGPDPDSSSSGTTGDPGWSWDLPEGFPEPYVPPDNPMSAAKVELGRHLFYDTRMSGSGTFACATCHLQELAFTDGRVTSIGETGQIHRRNSMSLANVAYNASLTWAHPFLTDLERQALVPLFGDNPIELGLDSEAELVANLAVEPLYADLFAAAFPDEAEPLTAANVVYALSAFQRTLISGRSAFDRWFYDGDDDAVDEAAKRGYQLFNSHPAECFHCHVNFNFTDTAYYEGASSWDVRFHNTGLYNVDGLGAYPASDPGLIEITMEPDDMGHFRVPTLRNIAVTAPYMHDGSIATLDEVLDHYAAGGRTIVDGPNAGVGSESPLRSTFVPGFELSAQDRADLLAFLAALTDDAFLTDPDLADPWQ
jgi:cytochrome c peroxidase